MRKNIVTVSVRTDEVWHRRSKSTNPQAVVKATVRVAKGQPKAGTFLGATNFRGTERPV